MIDANDYLTEQWFASAGSSLADITISSDNASPVAFSYEVADVPAGHPRAGSTVNYRVTLDPASGASIHQTDDRGDVHFTMSFELAHQVANGILSASKAFLAGDVRIGGEVSVLIERASEMAQLDDAFSAVGHA